MSLYGGLRERERQKMGGGGEKGGGGGKVGEGGGRGRTEGTVHATRAWTEMELIARSHIFGGNLSINFFCWESIDVEEMEIDG